MQALSALTGLSGLVGGGSFNPGSISGLALWLKADSGLFQDTSGVTPATADGDPVGRWEDQSGAGRHHTQSTGARQPTLRLAVQNGLAALEFDSDYLTASALSSLTAATAFLVVKIDADPPTGFATSALWSYGGASTTHFPSLDGIIYDTFGANSRHTTTDPAASLAAWNVYAVGSQSGQWTSWLNGSQLFNSGTNTVAWDASVTGLGASHDAGLFLKGFVGELLIYDSYLSATDRAAVEAYLKAKWGTP